MMSAGSPFSMARQQYPDPFLDTASTKLPKTQKKLFELLWLFGTTHPQISPIVKKLAKYPITQIVVNAENPDLKAVEKKWKNTLEHGLNFYEAAEAMGLDFFALGNCFITIHKPFIRTYQCKRCDKQNPAGSVKYYITNKKITGKCPGCKKKSSFKAHDNTIKNPTEISIVRIPPQEIHIKKVETAGKHFYYRDVPNSLKRALKKNKPDREIIDNTPWEYVKACMEKKKIRFKEGKILHLKEPSISGKSSEWGTPIIMAGLKDAYLNQIYKKADESVANERVVPARFVYPQPTSDNPLGTISLAKFSNFMGKSLRRWRQDKNAVMVSPFPVGVAEVGGDGQRLSTANLRQLTIKEIIGSTGVPEGFLAEGMAWSGGSVQLRMLENMIMGYKRALDRMLWFVIKEIKKITDWPHIEANMKPFRMADDIQMLQVLMQLAQMKHVSYKEILERVDLDWEEEHEKILKETEKVTDIQLKEALLEVKSMLQSVEYQVESQNRQESISSLMGEKDDAEEAAVSHIKRVKPFDDYKEEKGEEQEQAAAQEGEQEQEAQQVEQHLDQARAQKYEAEAASKETRVTPVVKNLTDRMLRMSDAEQQQQLERLEQTAPTIAKQVMEQLELRAGEAEAPAPTKEEQIAEQPPAEEQVHQEEDPKALVERLRLESKNPQEMADSIIMLPQNKKSQAFDYLKKTDPQLAGAVMKAMLKNYGSGSKKGGGSGKVNQSLPEQKPPRRK